MKIEINDKQLYAGLKAAAKKRNISVAQLVDQILCTELFIDKFLTKDDHDQIKTIFKKYLP